MDKNGKYLIAEEFAKLAGINTHSVSSDAWRGKIKDAYKDKNPATGREVYFVNVTELEKYKKNPKSLYGSGPQKIMPTVDTVDDFDLSQLKDFTIEKGTIPHKNMCLAVKMAFEKRSWEEIAEETGMKKGGVNTFISELQMAFKLEPTKFKTIMDYLKFGQRKYHPKNRDMRMNAKQLKK